MDPHEVNHGGRHSIILSRSRRKVKEGGPFQYLTYDLLSQIFLDCLLTDGHRMPHAETAPLKFCRVCSHWRSVALSTRLLWSHISIVIDIKSIDPRSYKGLDARSVKALRCFAARCSPLPMTIAYEHYRALRLRGKTSLIKELTNLVPRLKSLKLDAPICIVEPILEALRNDPSSLQALEVQVIPAVNQEIEDVNMETFSFRPTRGLFTSISSKSPSKSPPFNSPFSSLRRLQMHGIKATDILFVWLRQCTALEHVVFLFSSTAPLDDVSLDGVGVLQLPHLNTLKLIVMDATDRKTIQFLLDHLITPALHELSFLSGSFSKLREHHQIEFSSSVHDFLQRSSPPLETLCLKLGRWMRTNHLRDILILTPALRNITISHVFSDGLFEALTFKFHVFSLSGTQSSLCPLLRTIEFIFYHPDFFRREAVTDSKFVDMIASRCIGYIGDRRDDGEDGSTNAFGHARRRLQSVIISCPDHSFHSIVHNPLVVRCVAKGLQFEVYHRYLR